MTDKEQIAKLESELFAERQRRPAVTVEMFVKERQQLLSALAAIEKHNKMSIPVGGIDVDLSLLHEHDTEIWSELRDLLHLPSTDNDKSLVITEIKRLMEYERPALAKVKQ